MSHCLSVQTEGLPFGKNVRLLGKNQDGLVALEKPENILSHPNSEKDIRKPLLHTSYDLDGEFYFWEAAGERRRAWLVNRLDSATSGVILLALDGDLAEVVKKQFSGHHVNKVYYAVVRQSPSVPAGTWQDTLKKDVYRGNRLVKGGQRIPAKTRYQLVTRPKGGFPVSLLKLMPVTGRTHQLRVQCSQRGHPIVGDRTYGKFSFNREVRAETGVKRLLLHSAETSLRYAFRGQAREFRAESPLPDSFQQVMRFRPGVTRGYGGGD